jgi:hypothetical protein
MQPDSNALATHSQLLPPAGFPPEETEIWNRIAAGGRIAPAAVEVLAQLCRHVARSNQIARMIAMADRSPGMPLTERIALERMLARQSAKIGRLSADLGLTQQAQTRG